MKDTPEIIKELREQESNGVLLTTSLLSSHQSTPCIQSEDTTVNTDNDGLFESSQSLMDFEGPLENFDSQEIYRSLFNYSPDGIVVVDFRGTIISCNPATAKMTGFTIEELKGKHFTHTRIFNIKELPRYISLFSDILKGKTRGPFELKYFRKDGTSFWAEVHVSLLKNNNRISGLVAISRDISERKQNELELEEAKRHFEHLFNAFADPTVIVDRHGKFLDISDGVTNQTGFTRDELVGKNFLRTKLVTARSKTMLLANLAKRMTGLHISPYQIDVVTKQGDIIPFEINAAKINFKGQPADMVVFRDVRERRKTEEALRESEEKFRLLSDQSLMGIAIIQGKDIKYSNQAAANITEYSREELKNQGAELIQKIIHPDDRSFVMDQLKKKLHGDPDIVPHYSYKIITKSGKTRWLDQFSKTIDFAGNKADFITIIDITEKKEAEEKIKNQNIQLKKMDKLKTDFLNVTSHELRTPMTAMKGYLQMLITEVLGKLGDEQKSALDVIHRNTNRLDHLVQDILDTSRLESGTMKFIPSKTELPSMITDIVETMQLSAEIKQIKIDATLQQNLPGLVIDQERIKQVFDNIINNAIKFSSKESKIHVRAKQNKDFIQFEIQDFGKGIPVDKQDKIFETFYQVESGKDRTFGGTGLGLTISRGIILGHGGNIWVESKIDEGSTFIFTLPINPVQDVEGTFKKIDIFSIEEDDEKKVGQDR